MTNGSKNWLIGFGLGAVIAAALVIWYAPRTGSAFREAIKRGYFQAREEARLGAEERRQELEAELKRMQGKQPTPTRTLTR